MMEKLNKSKIIIFFISTIIIGTLALLYYINISKVQYINLSKKSLEQEAIAHFDNMVNVRTWNSNHGGIYALAKEGTEPNKYLDDSHAFTSDNKLLVKINPAWMTRQISEISNKTSEYKYKITSLKPINPENKPDEFDKKALEYLKTNNSEKFYSELGSERFDLMGSLEIKPSCFQCHNNKTYKIGDIRGGIRVSLPAQSYNERVTVVKKNSNLLILIVSCISLIVLIIGIYLVNSIYTRQKEIEELNSSLEEKIKERTKELENNVKKLHKLSTIDFLTQVPNRRYFFELSNKLFSLAKRDKMNLSLLMIDIDFFKIVNDSHGHFIGDEILKLISKKIYTNIRTSDVLARMGGEEFAVLLNETDKEGALIIAEKLRFLIENTSLQYEDSELKVTVSIGVSVYDSTKDEEIDDILIRADEALYLSKETGRNKVSFK